VLWEKVKVALLVMLPWMLVVSPISVPALTVQAWLPEPVSVHVEAPVFVNMVMPVYCTPMLLTLKLAMPVPLRSSVLLPARETFPVMELPGNSRRVLPPLKI
jgi:hypothetical protein